MSALLLYVTLIFVPEPHDYCPLYTACSINNTIYMRERKHLRGTYRGEVDISGIHFPHFNSKSLFSWWKCGFAIGEQLGIELGTNTAKTLCHELQHVVFPEYRH